ncbi:WD40/YVTN/BNR-like repeat-containing protein [Sphingomonas nostoxanthinifaciens]|uniref:WD40/YVTN/BNR-like repeat-containing protein n=1 Tax=Sphingomonas nostoxanthinifaciens TaxID=2872652 RepID=UPI001CC1F1E6|nr:glycosyl hydrolase [Sphingomonas nostoxanthinifaciens]UAK23221.1 glycosyl hydrolase [Sphingomonas nostoxanthinifaciens]
MHFYTENKMRGLRMAVAVLLAGTSFALQAAPASPAADLPLKGMKYRLVGPFRGGRASGVAGVPNDPNTYYFGAAAGGVWKTTDAGRTWKPLWDDLHDASPSIGAIVVAPSNPNILYVGTGEGAIRGNVVAGNGVWKSVDAGKSWTFSGLKESQYIGRMAISATDPNTVFVAALGPIFGTAGERGIYRTRDGGKTWQRVLHVDDRTGGVDVQIDPGDPNVIYAGMWEVFRKPWDFESGGPGSGLYRSRDGGTTWEKLAGHGLPDGIMGRIGVAPTSDPKRVYALIEADKGGLYRTDDGGANWNLVNGDNAYKQRAWYYNNVFADPKDPNKLFVMNTSAYKSTDGGKTFKKMPTFHGDNHQLWVNPVNPQLMINSNDGGANISVNGGETWTDEMNQPTAQFYHIATDALTPYNLYGSQQDNSSVVHASSNVRGPMAVESWHSVGGGESGYVVPDPKDPSVVIANSYGGKVTRYDHKTGQLTEIGPWPRESIGQAPKILLHRAQWTEPLAFSPHDPNVLYNANEVLWRSTDSGKSWTAISPDLTRNDKDKQIASGGPLTKDVTGVETYDTIFSVNESPVAKGLIWAGTDDGLVQLTRDGGASWSNVTPKAMPEWGTVDMVEPHPKKPGTAYIAVDCHRLDDLRPHAFRTDDYGKSWVSITDGLPADAYVHVVRADPVRDGLLYAGTENGIFVSFDDGGHWQPLQLNLPRTPVHDLVVHADDLAVATHGRSFWILDDVSPLRQWRPAIADETVHLFAPRVTKRVVYWGHGDGSTTSTGANPPQGAIIYYSLKTAAKPEAVKLEILDAQDRVVRTFPQPTQGAKPDEKPGTEEEFQPLAKSKLTMYAGLNRFAWDMRYEAPVKVPHSPLWNATGGGPIALPGAYKVRLTVAGKSQVQPFTIVPNPSLSVTQAQLQKQFDLVSAINAEFDAVQNAVLEIRGLHAKLDAMRKQAAGNAALLQAADALQAKVGLVEDKLYQKKSVAFEDPLNYPPALNNMLASLATTVGEGDTDPTQQSYALFEQLKAEAARDLAEWTALKANDLARFNAAAGQAKLAPIAVTTELERRRELALYGDEQVGVGDDDR